jgi:transcription initiation factor IIF auxiliary subunit
MDKLAENLQRLQEDDLLQVVQMVHDHKTADSYTKNDIDGMASHAVYQIRRLANNVAAGEFHVDLYTLPDTLIRMLWDFSASKVDGY